MNGTRCTCGKGCLTYGACLRAKNIHLGCIDRDEQKKWDQEIGEYRAARRQGVQPPTTKTADIRTAMEISNETGRAYDACIPMGGLALDG